VIPKPIIDTVAALRQERIPLAARLDAIDLAIESLSRVYGINGTPQPLPFVAAVAKPRKGKKAPVAPDSSDASERRDVLLALIAKSAVGLTGPELKKSTPKMGDKDRSNTIQQLKARGQIKRAGNTWIAA
jgi:hypothetical protein